MKKLLSLILIIALISSSFLGCSIKTSNSDPNNTKTNIKPELTDAGAGDLGITEENITISMMYSGVITEGDFETEILPALVKEKFPNINLEVTKLPDDQYYTALKTKLASGECPDIILVQPKYAGPNSVISLAKAGYLLDLTDLKCNDLAVDSLKDVYTYEGKIYGVAQGVSILGTYYNKDMFEENGLSVPTTWEEFLNCCEVLKKAGIQPIVMGDKDAYVMQFGLYQLAANEIYPNNPFYDDQLRTGETKFTDEGTWDKVFKMYYELYEKGYIIDSSLVLGAEQAIQLFIDGEAAMTFDGSFNVGALKTKGAVDFERGMFPLPGTGTEVYVSMAPGGGPAVFAGTKYPNEVKAILEYWYDGESDLYKAFADRKTVIITNGYGADNYDPLFEPFVQLYRQGKAWYWCNQAWPLGTDTEMKVIFGSMIGKQGTTVEDITKGMQIKLEELLDTQ
jgi:raffinose/stachyose/melibiose transport system substrate-binding protein